MAKKTQQINKPSKTKPIIKSISFTEEYFDVLEYLNTKRNASDYICQLLKKDMEGKIENIDDKVKKAIQEHLTSMMLASSTTNVVQEPKTARIEPQIKEEIELEEDILDDFFD